MHVHPVFHISRLKRFHERPADLRMPNQEDEVPPPPVIVDDHEEYEVEDILAKKKFGRQVKYLVHWKGYPIEASTWQSAADLENAAEIVQAFEARRQRSIEDDASSGGEPLLHAFTHSKSGRVYDVSNASSNGQVVCNSMVRNGMTQPSINAERMINAVIHSSPNMENSWNTIDLDGAQITKPDILPDKLWYLLVHSSDDL
jgi:hypothetical protein